MSFLRVSSVFRSVLPLQRQIPTRAFASKPTANDDKLQQLLLASRVGEIDTAESLAKELTPTRQVYGALAATYMFHQEFEKATEYASLAEKLN